MSEYVRLCIELKLWFQFSRWTAWETVSKSRKYLYVMEYILENLLLGDPEVGIVVFWVRADMDDAIHVQV